MAQARQSCDRNLAAARGGDRHYAAAVGAWSQERQAAYDSRLTVDGERYIIAGLEDGDWVKNARITGWGILERGREQERVYLVELPIQERAPVLGEFPQEVPHGVRYFRQLYGISGTPEESGSLAPRCPVFRVEEAGP
jgi:hypothetical protein